MTTLPIIRPGPFINYSIDPNNSDNTPVFINEPSSALNFIDPVNGACDSSQYWKWRYYLKQQKYNFTYGQGTIPTLTDESYHTFEDRKGTDINTSETKKLVDADSVLFEAGWSYVAPLDLEWELTYRCTNNATLGLHGCFAKYSYPGPAPEYGQIKVEDNGNEVNEISKRVKIILPKRVYPGRVDMMLYASVGEDIAAGAEIEFTWRFGPVGSFQD